jgi:hypothetical protein
LNPFEAVFIINAILIVDQPFFSSAILFGCLMLLLVFAALLFLRHLKRRRLVANERGANSPAFEAEDREKDLDEPSKVFVVVILPDEAMAVGYRVSAA